MNQNPMRRSVTGPLSAQFLSTGAWRLFTADPLGPEVFLRGAGADATEPLCATPIARLTLEWRRDSVTVSVTGAQANRSFSVAGALLHEPQAELYASLPLAGFDVGAQRFWRRVFRLMRIPGGRILLGLIARIGRRKRGPASQ